MEESVVRLLIIQLTHPRAAFSHNTVYNRAVAEKISQVKFIDVFTLILYQRVQVQAARCRAFQLLDPRFGLVQRMDERLGFRRLKFSNFIQNSGFNHLKCGNLICAQRGVYFLFTEAVLLPGDEKKQFHRAVAGCCHFLLQQPVVLSLGELAQGVVQGAICIQAFCGCGIGHYLFTHAAVVLLRFFEFAEHGERRIGCCCISDAL